jgi:hypothetical protein
LIVRLDVHETLEIYSVRFKTRCRQTTEKNRDYTLDDIAFIVHLIDTDGGYTSHEYIEPTSDVQSLTYLDDRIQVPHGNQHQGICHRNETKTNNTKSLYMATHICDKPYYIYYFSRNREHSLLGISENNLPGPQKRDLAYQIADMYSEDPLAFVELLNSKDICVKGTYKKTWKFIMTAANSLKRYTNFSLFFEKVISADALLQE